MSGDEAASRPSSPVRTFVALGDSLTAWAFAPGSTSPGANGAWPSVLAGQDPSLVLVSNAGIPGNTTSQMLSRLGRDVLAYKPDVLFLMGGTNDIGQDMSIANAVANIRRIVETSRANGITVILMTVPPVNGDYNYRTANRAEYNADLAALASQEGIMLVDVFSALATADGCLVPAYAAFDGLHLSQEGEQTVAEAVYLALHPTVPPEEE
jgi:lysophospholipase L1-like esterase